MSSKAWFIIFSGSSKLFKTLLIFDFATRWNRSNRFIDRAVVDLYEGDDVWHCVRRVKEDVVEKALADATDATSSRAVRKFIVADADE